MQNTNRKVFDKLLSKTKIYLAIIFHIASNRLYRKYYYDNTIYINFYSSFIIFILCKQ